MSAAGKAYCQGFDARDTSHAAPQRIGTDRPCACHPTASRRTCQEPVANTLVPENPGQGCICLHLPVARFALRKDGVVFGGKGAAAVEGEDALTHLHLGFSKSPPVWSPPIWAVSILAHSKSSTRHKIVAAGFSSRSTCNPSDKTSLPWRKTASAFLLKTSLRNLTL